jgi:hypothetical protein
MKKSKPKKTTPEQNDAEVPSWVTETPRRTTPHTEEEFDLLVDGTIEGIKDTAAWKDLVRRVGLQKARSVLRSRLIANDALDTMVTWN